MAPERSRPRRWSNRTSIIAGQFTNLIVAQEAYTANTKVVTTVNQLVQSLLSVIS